MRQQRVVGGQLEFGWRVEGDGLGGDSLASVTERGSRAKCHGRAPDITELGLNAGTAWLSGSEHNVCCSVLFLHPVCCACLLPSFVWFLRPLPLVL